MPVELIEGDFIKKYSIVFSIMCYVIGIFLLVIYGFVTLSSHFDISSLERIVLICLACLFLYFGGFLLSKYKNNNKPMRINLYFFFVLYILLFVTLILFDKGSSFQWSSIFHASEAKIQDYLSTKVNFIPFQTIIGYIKEFNVSLDSKTLVLNLYGNFVVCMPFAIFLPMLFRNQNQWKYYSLTIILIVFGVELIQFLSLSGSFDVDDFILNISGSLIMYGVFKIKSVNNLFRNIFLLERNMVSKKHIFVTVVTFICALVISALFLKQIARYYYFDYKEYNRTFNPKISFEYDENCSDNNLFYEDEIYRYYFDCYDNNLFYVIVNKEKFMIKDFLDNSEYNYDINRILGRMKYNNVEYYLEHKYTYYDFEVAINKRSYSTIYEIKNDYFKAILKEMDQENSFELNFIPLKAGTAMLELIFKIYDEEGQEVEYIIKKLNVTIKNDFSVIYEVIS